MTQRTAPITSTCLQLIQSDQATRDVIVASARAIIAEVEMNHRFAESKASVGRESFLADLETYEQLVESLAAESAASASVERLAGRLLDAVTQMNRLPTMGA